MDENGNTVSTYRYSAFGEEQISGSILSPWRYAGKRVETETGFIYFGKRYYDPKSLCWISQDPLGDADGPNLYAYVHNNPLLYVDRDGCFSLNLSWERLAALAAEVALTASIVGMGVAGVAEGFLAGCAGGVTGTAFDLAADAAMLYCEGGVSAACATAESSAISYNICKTVGRVAGAAFSCTPVGKAAQTGLCTAKMGLNAAQAANTAAHAIKTTQKIKIVNKIAVNTLKTGKATGENYYKLITPQILEGNRDYGLRHILRRHAYESNAKNASKFMEGIGRKEISGFVTEGCTKIKSWKIEDNGFLSSVYDTGKIVGIERNYGQSTSKIMIVLNNHRLHTAYPN